MSAEQDLITPALQAVLSVSLAGLSEPVGLAHLAGGGQVAWDDCCAGQLWVRLIEAYPTGRPFPQPDVGQPCGEISLVALRIGVGVMRCAHTVDDQGVPPSAAAMSSDARQTFLDASEVLTALNCGLPSWPIIIARVVGWTPQGPEGGCVGGEWELVCGIDWCGCEQAGPATSMPTPTATPSRL